MYTQQSNALASALALPAGQQQSQALLQVFANCIQGLRQNGPVSINTAAGSQAPRAGVITTPPGVGSVANRSAGGSNLQDYYNGYGDRPVNQYPPNVWNFNSYGGNTNNNYLTSNVSNLFGGNASSYFGGDLFYGDNYQTTNNFSNAQNFNLNSQSDYFTYNNSINNSDNSVNNNNISNWYNNQYTDNSYNDFSTTLQTTQNTYSQTVNNFEGDSYFDNTVNQGDVINESTVTHLGDVFHEGDTFLTDSRTFINDNDTTINLVDYVTNVVINIMQGRGPKGDKGDAGDALAPNYNFEGTPWPYKFEIKVKEFNPETCTNEEKTVTGEVRVTPYGKIVRVP